MLKIDVRADHFIMGGPYRDELVRIRITGDGHISGPSRLPERWELFGPGCVWRWVGCPQEGLRAEMWLSRFDHFPFVLVGGRLFVESSDPVYVEDFTPCEIEIARNDYRAARFLVNSGQQEFSGSVAVDDPRSTSLRCTTLCAFEGDRSGDCVAIGYVTMNRTYAVMHRERTGRSFTIRPELEYNQVRVDPGEFIALEELLIASDERGATRALEHWADATVRIIRPQFSRDLTGLYNTWYAYHKPGSDQASEELLLRGVEDLRASGLIDYGVTTTSFGVHHNRAAFGEPEDWPGMNPHGRGWAVEQLAECGLNLADGGFWGLVSECSSLFKRHPEWMVKDTGGKPKQQTDISWSACPYPCYALDITHPDAAAWLRHGPAGQLGKQGTRYVWIDFFFNGGGRDEGYVRCDEKVCAPAETLRKISATLKAGAGENAKVGLYTSYTNIHVGIADRVRLARDAGTIDPSPLEREYDDDGRIRLGSEKEMEQQWWSAKEVARNIAAGYFYHDRLWINDPDPPSVGLVDRPETLELARVRLMIVAASGGFVTVGEALSEMAPSRLEMLKTVLPPLGRAACPIDLMREEFPRVQHLHLDHCDGGWELLYLFNWDKQPRTIEVDLAALGAIGTHLAFEFWSRTFLGSINERLSFELPPRSGRLIRLSPDSGRPQVIGTDRHLAVGAQELPHVLWDAKRSILTGIARRPRRERGTVYLHVPQSWQVESTEGGSLVQDGEVEQLELSFEPTGTCWSVQFNESKQ